jgi:transcriptional regulator with XRE-family HTH domain
MPQPPPDSTSLDGALARFRAQVAAWREGQGISQAEAARRAGLTPDVWNRIERGITKDPQLGTVLRIQHALALGSLESLFGDPPSRLAVSGPRDLLRDPAD